LPASKLLILTGLGDECYTSTLEFNSSANMTLKKSTKFRVVRPSEKNGLMTEEVVNQVREMVHLGKLRPGDRLPPERDLAKQLGISRASLRTGLRFLSASGLLTSRHGSGTYIAAGPPILDSEPLSMLAALHGFTTEKMFEARRLVEVAVAGLAAENATDEQLRVMSDEVTDTYAALDNPQEYLVHDFGFHRAVATASGNPILAAFMEMLADILYERRCKTIGRSRDLKESVEMHRKIYHAIRARNPDAARKAMSEHLILAEQGLAAEEVAEVAKLSKSKRAQSKSSRKK
jgi:GntR family transcriptional regulator, transcriptional repressor for pyruvate dehydrogenase complex